MSKRIAYPSEGSRLAPISAAVQWGDLVWVSGLAAVDPSTGRLLAEGFAEQCDLVLSSLAALLERCGTSLSSVLSIECFLADASHFGLWNESFTRYFPEAPPARTTVTCGFAVPGILVEVQATCGAELR